MHLILIGEVRWKVRLEEAGLGRAPKLGSVLLCLAILALEGLFLKIPGSCQQLKPLQSDTSLPLTAYHSCGECLGRTCPEQIVRENK